MAEAEAIIARGDSSLELRRVRHLRTYLSADGRLAFCVYEAPDAEVVREGLRAGGRTWERVWVVDALQGVSRDDA